MKSSKPLSRTHMPDFHAQRHEAIAQAESAIERAEAELSRCRFEYDAGNRFYDQRRCDIAGAAVEAAKADRDHAQTYGFYWPGCGKGRDPEPEPTALERVMGVRLDDLISRLNVRGLR